MSQPVGAPAGNRNAVKHGMYSRSFKQAERQASSFFAEGGLKPEINLLRVLLSRLALRLKHAEAHSPLTLKQTIDALYTASTVIARLNVLYRTHPTSYQEKHKDLIIWLRRGDYSDEEIRREINRFEGRPSGAQAGNTNAIKHGLYASLFSPAELRKLENVSLDDLRDELALLRSLTRRLAELITSDPPELEEYLHALRVISYAGVVISSLRRTAGLIFPEESSFRQIWNKARDAFHFFAPEVEAEFRRDGLIGDPQEDFLPLEWPGDESPPPRQTNPAADA